MTSLKTRIDSITGILGLIEKKPLIKILNELADTYPTVRQIRNEHPNKTPQEQQTLLNQQTEEWYNTWLLDLQTTEHKLKQLGITM